MTKNHQNMSFDVLYYSNLTKYYVWQKKVWKHSIKSCVSQVPLRIVSRGLALNLFSVLYEEESELQIFFQMHAKCTYNVLISHHEFKHVFHITDSLFIDDYLMWRSDCKMSLTCKRHNHKHWAAHCHMCEYIHAFPDNCNGIWNIEKDKLSE